MLQSFRVESPGRLFPSGRVALSREEAARHGAKLKAIATAGDLLVCEIVEPVVLLEGVKGGATLEALEASSIVNIQLGAAADPPVLEAEQPAVADEAQEAAELPEGSAAQQEQPLPEAAGSAEQTIQPSEAGE